MDLIWWLGNRRGIGGAVVVATNLNEACERVRWNKADVIVKKVRVYIQEGAVERRDQAQAELEHILKGGQS